MMEKALSSAGELTAGDSEASVSHKLALEAGLIGHGVFDGAGHALQDMAAAPLLTALKLASSGTMGFALAGLAKRQPLVSSAVDLAMKSLLAVDLVVRVGSVFKSGIDTWKHPDHYADNEKKDEQALGRGLIDYAAIGGATAGGFALGKRYFVEGGLIKVRTALEAGLQKMGDGVPQLKLKGLNERPSISASKDPVGTSIFFENRNKVVHIDFGGSGGTGFIVDGKRGWIATNWHVANARGRFSPTIINPNGTASSLEFIGGDMNADLAIMRAKQPPLNPWPEVELGKGGELDRGSKVYALGHPRLLEEPILSSGRFMRFRHKDAVTSSEGDLPRIAEVVATTPSLGGSSGSPMFDETGKVVAMLRAGAKNGDYSVGTSSEHVSAVVESLRSAEALPEGSWLDVKTKLASRGRDNLKGPLDVEAFSEVRPPATPVEMPAEYVTEPEPESSAYSGIVAASTGFAGAVNFLDTVSSLVPQDLQDPN
jgi:S1-C subfamily serine protease